MTTAIIVQARMGSTRLPGKVLMDLGGRTVLDHVLTRCKSTAAADHVCLATSTLTRDDELARAAKKMGVIVYRGDEADVLSRYHGAARLIGASDVLRVTADCPLIDPDVCSAVIRLRQTSGKDYACNFSPASFPHGLDCEAFTFSALDRAFTNSQSAFEREHVTVWLIENSVIQKSNLVQTGPDFSKHRWTLDTPDDYLFLSRLFARIPATDTVIGWKAVMDIVQGDPDLLGLSLKH